MNKLNTLVAILLAISISIPANADQQPFADCGVIEQGVEAGCYLFESDHYGTYELYGIIIPTSQFDVGDTVKISGTVETGNFSWCMQGDGLLTVESIDSCTPINYGFYIDECGYLSLGMGCWLFESDNFGVYELHIYEPPDITLEVGARVRIQGDVFFSAPSICMVGNGFLQVDSISICAYEGDHYYIIDCGVLAPGYITGCEIFISDNYGEFALRYLPGDYNVGDTVMISGTVDPSCPIYCAQGGGCLWIDSIQACPAGDAEYPITDCGYIVEGLGCLLFDTDNNDIYELRYIPFPFEYSIGDYVRIVGMVDPGCFSFCMQGDCLSIDSIEFCLHTDATGEGNNFPSDFTLGNNYPNPFNPATTIKYTLKNREHVLITVYDVRGSVVAVLVSEMQKRGTHTVQWDGNNLNGNKTATGVYFYRIEAGDYIKTRKMVLLR